jgi:hypothetical protein
LDIEKGKDPDDGYINQGTPKFFSKTSEGRGEEQNRFCLTALRRN